MKKHNLREKSRLLVEHILNKDFLEANSVLEKLISEAEEDRENAVSAEFGFESEKGGNETPNDGGEDVQLDASPEGMSDEDATKTVDDAIEIACQINAKIVAKLFDKVSALKQDLDNANLDQDSREFIKFDTSITYYSDKLQDLQGKTNPGVDQAKVEEALNKIDSDASILDFDRATAFWEDDIKAFIDEINALLATDNLSPSEIAKLGEYKAQAEKLIGIINNPVKYVSLRFFYLIWDCLLWKYGFISEFFADVIASILKGC